MTLAPRRRSSHRLRPLLASLALPFLAACASQPRAAGVEAPSAAPDPAALYAPGGGRVVLSPDGDWLVDENGQKYYLVEVERRPEYKILPQGAVILPPGAAYQLVEAREDVLVVKILHHDRSVAAPAAVADRSSAVADLERLETATRDRLRFARFDRGLPRRGQWRQGFVLVDIDGDGHLDIVHGPPRKGDGQPKIFLGDGAGGWRLWREARFESQPLDYGDIAVADLDGDGNLDLALAVHLRGLVVLIGDGQGTFRQRGEGLPYWVPGAAEQPPSFSSRTVEVVDWDRDGRPDLLTLGEGPRMARRSGAKTPDFHLGDRGAILFLNRGEGLWERYDQGTGRDRVYGDDLAVGDFDGDGLADFAIASRVAGATRLVMLGTADGGWEEVSLGGDIVRRGVYGSAHALDLDGDGRDELLLGYSASGAGADRWTGVDRLDWEDGSWRRTPLVAEQRDLGGVTALATGDLDGDGRQDLVALTRAGERWIFLAAPDGSLVREQSAELAPSEPGCQGYAAAVARLGGRTVVFMGFAGEPGSEQIIPGLEKRCPSEGSLEAWSAAGAK